MSRVAGVSRRVTHELPDAVQIMPTAVVQPEKPACDCGHSHHDPHDDGDGSERGPRPPASSIAQQLWMPWLVIVMNPLATLAVYVLFNVVFISLSLLVSLLVWLLTLPGLALLVAAAVFLALRKVAQLVTYPGQLGLVVRDGENNFARLTRRRLTMAIEAALELATALADNDTTPNHARRMRVLQRHQNCVFSVETLVLPTLRALERLDKGDDGGGLGSGLGVNSAKLRTLLHEFERFYTTELRTCCAELCNASAKDFELRRQQLFLTVTTNRNNSDTASPWARGRVVATLEAKMEQLRELVPCIGEPSAVANAKKDLAWAARELLQRPSADGDIVTTLDFIRADLAARFHGEQVWISGHENHQIDAMFIPAAGGFAVDKPAVILCNPNGGLYEFHHFQMDWVKFYTDLECHVLLFNYRGYGRSKGTPSPWAHNLDAMALVDFLQTRKGITKIGVHGESIGGLVATYLAKHSNAIQVLVADRTFANLPALAERLVASWAGRAVRWLTLWETDNAGNFLAATCPKLLCSDPNDEIILDGASLKSGVALRVELGDERFNLPAPIPLTDISIDDDDDGHDKDDDGSHASLRMWLEDKYPVLSKCPVLFAGDSRGVVRRLSGADAKPQLGGALTEASVRRFCEAALSLGRRAMLYADRRDAGQVGGGDATARVSHVEISMGDESSSLRQPLSFSEELLAVVWMQLASLDGYCGQCFLQAAESGGSDRVRSWTASLLAWGGQLPQNKRQQFTLEPFERQGLAIRPLTIFQVHKSLQAIAEKHPGVKFDIDIGVVLQMVEYLMDALNRRWKRLDDELAKKMTAGPNSSINAAGKTAHSLGQLLVLHCGHNRQFADAEKAELTEFLRSSGFLPSATTATGKR